ncbi:MAG: enoyl-CoA hydratase-related protein, partial [Acidimicrobiia bacterium]
STHHHKVNFCKFTNETRLAMEQASARSGQVWLAALNGTSAGGGYELALACDEIVLVDDRSSAVSLPEVPLLGVLPATGGLTRLVDKRHVRRDLADVFATRVEGVRGAQAVEWGLVDSIAPRSRFAEHVRQRALERAAGSDRPAEATGVSLTPLERREEGDIARYSLVEVQVDRDLSTAFITIQGPSGALPVDAEAIVEAGASFWALAACRELDDAMLRLRFNEPGLGTWVFRSKGDVEAVLALDALLGVCDEHWLGREIRLGWLRVLKRLDGSARSIVALVEPGSCFAGTLAELVLAADRSFMLEGTFEDHIGEDQADTSAVLALSEANLGWYPMGSGLSRLEARFFGWPETLAAAAAHVGKELAASEAAGLGLVTSTPDDIDWEDEVRLTLEERSSFSPDALTGLEANLRFVGPETLETKIFGRLSAWQNWIFQRPSASGPDGALRSYGTGSRPTFDRNRT